MILGIYGSGGLGREVLDLARAICSFENKWERIVFINDFKSANSINDSKVYTFEEFKERFTIDEAMISIAIGEPLFRQTLRERASIEGYRLQTLIHPTAFVGYGTQIGNGAIIQFGSFISCNVIVGINALIQQNTSIGHDSVVGDDSVLSNYVSVSGACRIGNQTYIGVSVPVREKVSIDSRTIIGMGSVVIHDIPGNVVAFGNPARVMRENISGYVFKQEE